MDIKGRATRLRPPHGQFAAQPALKPLATLRLVIATLAWGLSWAARKPAVAVGRTRQPCPHASRRPLPSDETDVGPDRSSNGRSGYRTTKRRLRSSVTCSAGRPLSRRRKATNNSRMPADDSALREYDESGGTRYSERLVAQKEIRLLQRDEPLAA